MYVLQLCAYFCIYAFKYLPTWALSINFGTDAPVYYQDLGGIKHFLLILPFACSVILYNTLFYSQSFFKKCINTCFAYDDSFSCISYVRIHMFYSREVMFYPTQTKTEPTCRKSILRYPTHPGSPTYTNIFNKDFLKNE